MKPAKRCKNKKCNRVIREWNKSGFCSACTMREYKKGEVYQAYLKKLKKKK